MVWLIEDFERRATPSSKPRRTTCEGNSRKHRACANPNLLPVFGLRRYVSDVMNGKRGISKVKAKELAEFFHVLPELFL